MNTKRLYLLFGALFLFNSLHIIAQTPTISSQNEDKDKDGVSVEQGDCDDYQPLVYPGANEIEDGQDNNCDGLVDAVEGDCDDFTDPGEIAGTETLCEGALPNLIENVSSPTGGSGEMQIMWIYTNDDPEQTYPEWYIIPNAHNLTLQPAAISQTTWFGRCVRRAGCWKFPNESNIIKKTVSTDCGEIDCSDLVVTLLSSEIPDCDGNLGDAIVTVTGGTTPYTFIWSDDVTTQDRTDLQGGNYQVTVTDVNGCSSTAQVNIPTPSCAPDCSTFSVDANSSPPDCDGNLGFINLTVNNGIMPITYTWSDGTTIKDRTDLQSGVYLVMVMDANGCSDTVQVNIPTPACPPGPDCSAFSVVVANSNSPDCEGNLGNINLTINNGVAPMTYNWSDGAMTKDRNDLSGGNYQVTVTDANGCNGIAEVNLPSPSCAPDCSTFSVDANSGPPDCDGNLGFINLTVNNGIMPITYTWSDGTTIKDRTDLSGGNYQVTVTDANGCNGMVEVNLPSPSCAPDCSIFAAQIINTTAPDCEGNQGTIDISFINGLAPITYTWSDGFTTANRTGLTGGNYEVTITDANGCSDNLQINIPAPDCSAQCSIFDVQSATTAPDCNDNLGSIDLSVQNGLAPLTYAWQDGATSEDRTGLAGGSYIVTVSDANGCFKIVDISIPTPNCATGCDNFIIPFTITNVTCSENSGGINISAFGGTAPYSFNWADLEGNIEDRNELTVGVYDVTVTDAVGCEKTASITVGTADCVLEITPFDCPASFFQIVEGQFNIVDFANDSLIPLGEEGGNLNPLGYNVEDNFVYGIQFGTTDFVRIGKNGNRETIGRIQGINVGLFSGDFDLEGNYYLLDNASQKLQRVDISAPVLVAATVGLSAVIPSLADVSYNPIDELLYGVSEFTNDVFTIHPITGEVKNFKVEDLPIGTVGSTWMTSRGDFVVNYNVSGEIYVVDIAAQSARLLGNNGGSVSNADGANCVQAPSPFGEADMLFNPDFSFRNVSGTITNEIAKINYEVEHEAHNAHYVLEHSTDGVNFKVLPYLEFANGETLQTYTMQDETPALGSGLYRVKYVEADGEFTYSDLIPLLFKPDGTPDVIIHPNPFTEEMMINFLDPLAQDAEVLVVNNLGKVMEVCSAAQGATRMNISCPSYPPGLYTVYIKPQGKLPIVYRTLKVE